MARQNLLKLPADHVSWGAEGRALKGFIFKDRWVGQQVVRECVCVFVVWAFAFFCMLAYVHPNMCICRYARTDWHTSIRLIYIDRFYRTGIRGLGQSAIAEQDGRKIHFRPTKVLSHVPVFDHFCDPCQHPGHA